MSRAQRLLDLIQILRTHKYAVTGATLANELDVSLRTIYRDVVTLQDLGAQINGEAGIGYTLQSGFVLPPLMFSQEEIEALVLGSKWVANQNDATIASAAQNALSKIATVLPDKLREDLDASIVLVGPRAISAKYPFELASVRLAIRREIKLNIKYLDLSENASHRTIWPIALAFFDSVQIIVGWCELRHDFRHFRADRVFELNVSDEKYPSSRQDLLTEWREKQGIPQKQ